MSAAFLNFSRCTVCNCNSFVTVKNGLKWQLLLIFNILIKTAEKIHLISNASKARPNWKLPALRARLFECFQRQQEQLQRSLDNSESERRDTFPSAMLIEYQTHWVGTHVAYQTTWITERYFAEVPLLLARLQHRPH